MSRCRVRAWSLNELWWPDPGTVSIVVAECSVHFQWAMHQTVQILMPSSALIRCRPPGIDNYLSTRGMGALSHVTCHVSHVTWQDCGHTRHVPRVESPQTAPDGPGPDSAFSIQSSFGNIKLLWYKIGRWCNSSQILMPLSRCLIQCSDGIWDVWPQSMQFIAISCGSHLSFLVVL